MNYEKCIAELLNAIDVAIKCGDWKVDGACDPATVIDFAEYILRQNGWVQNGVSGEWMK